MADLNPDGTCAHVNGPMIAAGFLVCAVCENDPTPPPGFMEDGVARQERALAAAHAQLADALGALATESTRAAKACARKRPAPDMDRVRAAMRDVDLAEQNVDTAVYDLACAKGAHG